MSGRLTRPRNRTSDRREVSPWRGQRKKKLPIGERISLHNGTERRMRDLAALKPETLAIMHESSFRGDGESALNELSSVLKKIFGKEG